MRHVDGAAPMVPGICFPQENSAWHLRSVWRLPLLVFLTIVSYAPLRDAGFIWDDDDYVTENPLLVEPGGLERIWFSPRELPQYYPLVHTTFWIEHRLWGFEPFGYHLVNVLLHAANAILLWRLLRRLGLPVAYTVAALFAVHPLMVESVAWITERKNVLSLFFYFIAVHGLLRWREMLDDGVAPNARRKIVYSLALLAFVAALASKTVTCSLPAAWLIVRYWKCGRIDRTDLLATLPFFALGFLAAWNTSHLERVHVKAEGVDWSWSFLERCVIALRALGFYVTKLVWPHPLIFNYPKWSLDGPHPLDITGGACLVLFAVAARAAVRFGRRGLLAGSLLFAGTLLPALGFVDVYPMLFSFVADHFAYHAAPAFLTMAATLIHGLLVARSKERFATLAAVIVVGLFGAMTFLRCPVYESRETLWRDTIVRNPESWIGWNNLGRELMLRRELQEAEAAFREALVHRPDYPEALNNYGMLEFARDRLDEAARFYEQALASRSNDPAALNNLGNVYLKRGRYEEALPYYERAITAAPEATNAPFNAGVALAALGRHEEALAQLRKVLGKRPDDGPAHYRMGQSLRALRRYADALPHDRRAVALYPDHAESRFGLGISLGATGDYLSAAQAFAVVLRLHPGHDGARQNLAAAVASERARNRNLSGVEFITSLLRTTPDEARPVLLHYADRIGPTDPAEAAAARKQPE